MRRLVVLCFLGTLTVGCNGKSDSGSSATDGDGDGVSATEDCDDSDPMVFPGADEACDGADNDCDGIIDEGVKVTQFVDNDGDGYGHTSSVEEVCPGTSGYADVVGDCDDLDPAVNPGAAEECDDADNDCDGAIDEGVTTSFYVDEDGDGYGTSQRVEACEPSSGYAAQSGDCHDGDASSYPDAPELCDGADNDCDGDIDEGAKGTMNWYADVDGDGYGDPFSVTESCTQPPGHVSNDDDCDDTSDARNPDQVEICDGFDNDCDGDVDGATAVDAPTWFPDGDADGFGAGDAGVVQCDAPKGYIADGTDCDDANPAANPSEVELCDGFDNDCDSLVDDGSALDADTFYTDADGDGYGVLESTVDACALPKGFAVDSGDCDDGDALIHPDADEYCDGVDNNCDSSIDGPDALDPATWYRDVDGDGAGIDGDTVQACDEPVGYAAVSGDCDDSDPEIGADLPWHPDEDQDGYGDPLVFVNSCVEVPGYVANGDDCNDSDPTLNPETPWYEDTDGDGYGDPDVVTLGCESPGVGWLRDGSDCQPGMPTGYPGADEYCDGIDTDCNEVLDDDYALDALVWWHDSDGDGVGGSATSLVACEPEAGYVESSDDCDDGNALVSPWLPELCDDLDNDCNEVVDDEYAVDAPTWYADNDGDSYGDAALPAVACDPPSGYVANDDDCDDLDPLLHPETVWYWDADGDLYGDDDVTAVNCNQPDKTFVLVGGDCDPVRSLINPGADEFCDGIDSDCNGVLDDDYALDALEFFEDNDEDGHGVPGTSVFACTQPVGMVLVDDDCDDADPARAPTLPEYCDDIDNDCNEVVDDDYAVDATVWYLDADGDGEGAVASAEMHCDPPSGYVPVSGDCDDLDPALNSSTTWYRDVDEDGFGDDGTATVQCSTPGGGSPWVLQGGDCEPTHADSYPGAEERCDGIDSDCNGVPDDDYAVDAFEFFEDNDGDGHGVAGTGVFACAVPAGMSPFDDDCDDADPARAPSLIEFCDDIDNDCNEVVDDEYAVDATVWYLDADGDGEGADVTAELRCDPLADHVPVGGDCDDFDPELNSSTIWYQDVDEDGFGDDLTIMVQCSMPGGGSPWVLEGGDCEPELSNAYPGAEEIAGDGIDQDCDGVDLSCTTDTVTIVATDAASLDYSGTGGVWPGELYVYEDPSFPYDIVGWMLFDLSAIPVGSSVDSVQLMTYAWAVSGVPEIGLRYSTYDAWDRYSLTSAEIPRDLEVSALYADVVTAAWHTADVDLFAWDIDADVADGWLTLGADNYNDTGYNYAYLYGPDTVGFEPYIEVEYSTCASGVTTFTGVLNNVDPASLDGWEECFSDYFRDTSNLGTITSQCDKSHLMVACRQTGTTQLVAAAYAPIADVMYDTGTSNTPHNANGVDWYFSDSYSWGYAHEGDGISRSSCDTATGAYPEDRVCFHTSVGNLSGGYRCGATLALNSSADWERVFLHADVPHHRSEPFVPTDSQGQYCDGEAPVHWAYFGEMTFSECQEKANATGTQWFVGHWTDYVNGWIGYQDPDNAVVVGGSWSTEEIVASTDLYSCTLGQVEHWQEPTVSPASQSYVDHQGRRWVYWELLSQTSAQAISFADDRGARIISPEAVGRPGEVFGTPQTHWCYATAQFNSSGNCNGDTLCDFLVGYWE